MRHCRKYLEITDGMLKLNGLKTSCTKANKFPTEDLYVNALVLCVTKCGIGKVNK
jgi:hypothetical protein